MRRTGATATAAIVAMAAALAVGCGDGDGTTVTETDAATTTTTTTGGGGDRTVPDGTGEEGRTAEAWFVRGSRLFVTTREIGNTPRVGTRAIEEVLAGPSEAARDAGVSSAVPEGTELLGLTVADGVATADLSEEFAAGDGLRAEDLRLAQLVYTLTQFSTVDAVTLEIGGEPVELFGSHGIETEEPLTRDRFRRLLPQITATSPEIGETVSPPIGIAGTANVFEANVSIEVRDADGDTLVSTFATATCGSGCRGAFSKRVGIPGGYAGPVTVELFESSARDGSRSALVRIPVTVER